MTRRTHGYHCDGLNAIAFARARDVDAAARMFAHRLAVQMFGRAGRMLSIRCVQRDPRVHRCPRTHKYYACIGKRAGPTTGTPLLVIEDPINN